MPNHKMSSRAPVKVGEIFCGCEARGIIRGTGMRPGSGKTGWKGAGFFRDDFDRSAREVPSSVLFQANADKFSIFA